ncbi:MAG TPA: hypothetical protein VMV10_12455 [Pirellulales bacterium]|nr:hypothetical protein [Pirellulales bacterium]
MAAPFQFSVRTALITTSLFAAAVAVLNTENEWFAGVGLLLLTPYFPSVLLLGLLRLPANRCAFCVGAIFPACAAMVVLMNKIYGSAWNAIPAPPGMAVAPASQLTLEYVQAFLTALSDFETRFVIGVCWVTMPLTGLLCVATDWVFQGPIFGSSPVESEDR